MTWGGALRGDGVRADVGVLRGARGAVAYALIANWDPAHGDPREEVVAAMRRFGTRLAAAL